MPKGEKIRPKQEMDQLPLVKLKIVELEFLFVKMLLLSSCLFVSYCQVSLLWGEGLIMGKGGVFEILDQFLVEYLSLCFNMCV